MAKSPTVVLHIGAHKTATTHLQMTLQSVRDDLRSEGVVFYGPSQLRHEGATLAERFALPHVKDGGLIADDPRTVWADMSNGVDRVVFSEENFVGVLNRVGGQLTFPLYANAVERIAALASVVAPDGIDLFLSIRAPATFLNSVYSQILMSGGKVRPEVFKAKNSLNDVNWVKFVEQLLRIQSLRSLIVWPYEDYEAHFGRVVGLMVGDRPSKFVDWEASWAHRGLSSRAVAELFALKSSDRTQRKAKLIKTRFPASDQFPPFDVFTGEDHAQSGVIYADQIKALEQMPRVTLLRA